jgi:hypothetical protein
MPKEKMAWVRPILTVLTRGGDRAEMVLAGCKYVPFPMYLGSFSRDNGCWLTFGTGGCYNICSDHNVS